MDYERACSDFYVTEMGPNSGGALLGLDGDAVERGLPIADRQRPPFADIAQGPIEQLDQCPIAAERVAVLCQPAQAVVHQLDGIGDADRLANLRWVGEEWD